MMLSLQDPEDSSLLSCIFITGLYFAATEPQLKGEEALTSLITRLQIANKCGRNANFYLHFLSKI